MTERNASCPWCLAAADDSPYRSFHKGDSRAALAPFLAHKALGKSYKWLLYGDDDTQFFVDGVLRLVQDFDPEVPWLLTDECL